MKTMVTAPRVFARCILLLCALALALVGCSQSNSTTNQQTDPPSEDVIEALVHGPVESAFLEPLKPSLELTTYDGSQDPRELRPAHP
jgi:PBP1b-binding outer membrane lipoprotein LpoB